MIAIGQSPPVVLANEPGAPQDYVTAEAASAHAAETTKAATTVRLVQFLIVGGSALALGTLAFWALRRA
jgi:hypothetical protein